jgi:hypothetical protein
MKKQSHRLSLSRETLYTLNDGSLSNANGGTSPLALTLTPEIGALTYATYKLARSN